MNNLDFDKGDKTDGANYHGQARFVKMERASLAAGVGAATSKIRR
jgi:hypothetical protein